METLPSIKSLTLAELEERFRAWGEPRYRAAQVIEWLYRKAREIVCRDE